MPANQSPNTNLGSVRLRSRGAAALLGALIGAGVWLGAWLLLLVGQLGNPHRDNLWVAGAYELKQQAAQRLSGEPKLIVVGGSASMFGVDSAQLGERLHWPAVNFGVNAGVGTSAVPSLADPWVAEGDLVVMPLEYRLLLWDGVPSYVTLTWALEHPEVIARWPWRTRLQALWKISLQRAYQGYSDIEDLNVSAGPYGAHRLDTWGNQTGSGSAARSAAQLSTLQAQPPETFLERLGDSEIGLTEWSEWWQRWEQRGACVLIVPPPLMRHPDYAQPDWREFFTRVQARVEARGGRYLGSPAETFFPVESMFDTNYHLTAEARSRYTAWLADLLSERAADCVARG